MKNKIVFRADGNQKIGLGHLYRILSLMQMMQDYFEVTLLTRESSDYRTIFKGFKVLEIPVFSKKEELNWIKKTFKNKNYSFILDGYEFDNTYQKEINLVANKIVVIDDFDKTFPNADLVINHSPLLEHQKEIKKIGKTIYARGTKYAILRPLFLKEAKKQASLSSLNKKVLVCFGGSDYYNLTNRTINLLLKIKEVEEINVVLGSSYKGELSHKHSKITILKTLSEKEMLENFRANDRIIVSASTTLYEAISVRKYILSGYYTDNQKMIYNGFNQGNTIIGVGDFLTLSDKEYLLYLNKLVTCTTPLMLENQQKYIDGGSKHRITNLIKTIHESSNIGR